MFLVADGGITNATSPEARILIQGGGNPEIKFLNISGAFRVFTILFENISGGGGESILIPTPPDTGALNVTNPLLFL